MKLPIQAPAVLRQGPYGASYQTFSRTLPFPSSFPAGVRPQGNYVCQCDSTHSVTCPKGIGCHFVNGFCVCKSAP